MRYSWLRLIIPLVLISLACNLSQQANDKLPSPTPPIWQPPTVVLLPTSQPPVAPPVTNPWLTPVAVAPSPSPIGCLLRADWPVMTVQAGDFLSSIAERTGTTIDALVAGNCLANPDLLVVGQELRVPFIPAPPTAAPTSTPPVVCSTEWFFTFREGFKPSGGVASLSCPNAVQIMDAVGQSFEGGRVYWYQASSRGERDILYVIYNDGTWESHLDEWLSGQTESDPAIVPPPARYQPVRGIGKIWREQPGVRDKLGWAYAPEAYFVGRRQQTIGGSNILPFDVGYSIYVDHGTRGLVLLLTQASAANGGRRWQVAGSYQ